VASRTRESVHGPRGVKHLGDGWHEGCGKGTVACVADNARPGNLYINMLWLLGIANECPEQLASAGLRGTDRGGP
jgi:hypothetical protein